MKYITITSSNLAKYTGHNNYDSLEKKVNELLSKNGIEDRYVPKSNIEESLVNLSNEDLNSLKKELNISAESTITQIESLIKNTIMNKSYSSNLTEEQSKLLIDSNTIGKPILQKVSQSIKRDLRMRRGNIKENKNLDKIQSTKHIKITQRNSRMYVKELFRCDDYVIVIRGKVDGHAVGEDGEGVIIESKNRTRGLFKELRSYEQVQLEAYMYLTGLNKAILTEHYNDTEHCIEYIHDSEFWDDCLLELINFIDTHIKPFIKKK